MARAPRTGGYGEGALKKRKRNSSGSERGAKVGRVEEGGGVGSWTLGEEDGLKILGVLEGTDSLGLLDRVFPPQSLSLRALLTTHNLHSLPVLRTAVHNLWPRAPHPRDRPHHTAAQQLRFCTLALRLLDHASTHIAPLPATAPLPPAFFHPPPSPSAPPSPSLSIHRYALVQHLPSGDYWSSLNSRFPASSPDLPLKDLPTAHAELVSILPTPSDALASVPIPTLASIAPQKSLPKKLSFPQRRLTVGSFLDYGPWSSFAPSFDHDCELVGHRELGEVLWYRRERKAQRDAQLREWIQDRGSVLDLAPLPPSTQPDTQPLDLQTEFDGILPPEVLQNLKAALHSVELESLVDELLTRNQRALVRLQELQINRLSKEGSSTSIDESSEEWQIAHGIMESLETITSLRPRASNGDVLSILPHPSVLRKLHRSLALEPHPGWHGTLAPTRATALRDDSTVKVTSNSTSAIPAATAATATVSTSSSPAPTSVTPVTSIAPTTTPYAGYTYAYSAQQAQAYRSAGATVATAAYAPYKTGATSYYQNYLQNAQQQQQQYYGQQAYGVGATSQQPYAAYTNWFAHAQQYAASAAAANTAAAGRGTPQPATGTPTPSAYAAYYQQQPAAAQQQRTVAATGVATPVANTVAINKATSAAGAAGVGVWGGYPVGQQPTLPTRSSATAGVTTATTTTPAPNGYQVAQQQGYYGAYQTQQQQQQQQQPAAR